MCWKNKEVGGVKRSSSDETWNGFKFLLRMWSTIGCHMSIQHEFNNNGVDHSCRLEKKKWTSLWKDRRKTKWIIIPDEAFSNRHEKTAF